MADFDEICKQILKEHGPLLGSELQHYLVDRTEVNANYARQIVHRLKKNKVILSTDPVKFVRNQVLYFLPRQNIKKKLASVLPDHAQTLNRLFLALSEQDGFLLWSEFAKISSGIINSEQNHNKKTVEAIYNDMYKLGLVEPIRRFNHTSVVIAKEDWVPRVNATDSKMYQRIQDAIFNRQLTLDLLQWLEKMNLAGWNSSYDDADVDGYNGFYWDAVSYSYLWGLYKTDRKESLFSPGEEKTGSLIVIESVLHREMKMYDLSGFIARVSVLYGKLKTRDNFRIIPICFVHSIDSEALLLARKRGIMIVALSDVFGTRIAEALKVVRDLDPRKVDAEALAKVLEAADASGQDGKFGSLKGYVFNFLVASIFSNYNFSPKMGVKYDNKLGKKCECDIWISVDEDYLIVCEVKGYNEGIQVKLGETIEDSDSVKKFFERTCRLVRELSGKDVLPVFVTSGQFSPEAIEYLKQQNETKRFKRLIEERNFPNSVYYDRKALISLFGNKQYYSEHKKILKEFFRDHKKDK